jgi:hypothetical protein
VAAAAGKEAKVAVAQKLTVAPALSTAVWKILAGAPALTTDMHLAPALSTDMQHLAPAAETKYTAA